jgi:hypothetical protein
MDLAPTFPLFSVRRFIPDISVSKITVSDGDGHLTHVGGSMQRRLSHPPGAVSKRRSDDRFLNSPDHKFEPDHRQRPLIWQYARASCTSRS